MQPPDDPRARVVGKVLDVIGIGALPVGVGIVIGFYLADRGILLIPSVLSLVMVMTLVAIVIIVVGRWLQGKALVKTKDGVRPRKRILFALLAAELAMGGRLVLWWVEDESELTELEPNEYETAFETDLQQYKDHARALELLLGRIDDSDIVPPGDAVLNATQEQALLDVWTSFVDYAIALDRIRKFHEDYFRFDPSRAQRRYHLRSFLLTFAAELALYEKMSRFTARLLANKSARKFLDAPHPELGIPADSFSHLRQDLLGTRDQARVLAGEQYLHFLRKAFSARSEAKALGVDWVWQRIEDNIREIEAANFIDRATVTVRADSQLLKRSARRVWFPIQKETAEWMGDTRVRRIGWYLIDEAQQEAIAAEAEPGDVMLSRKNWYLSNVGLPGFWPHALLYVGDRDELEAYFDTPEVKAWVREQTGEDLSFAQYLEREHRRAWIAFQAPDDSGPHRVIEAISEGVVFNTLAHASGDYLAVMRPNLSKVDKAQAVAAAFGHFGKPYDFDFDFATDHALVCTELVWRSYRPAEGKNGLRIDLVDLAGRRTLPANEIAKLFADEYGRPDAQLEFVAFVDALERKREVGRADAETFAASHRRPKWDVAQK